MTTQPSRRGRGRPPHPDILTPREWQVLDLLRQDLTNEQIAHRLDISPATAKYHVSEILSKLGVETRERAAVWQPPTEAPAWRRLFAPLTVAKAAGIATSVAVVAGIAVLAWSALRTEVTGTDDRTAANLSTASATPIPGDTVFAPLTITGAEKTKLFFTRGQTGFYEPGALWMSNLDGSDSEALIDESAVSDVLRVVRHYQTGNPTVFYTVREPLERFPAIPRGRQTVSTLDLVTGDRAELVAFEIEGNQAEAAADVTIDGRLIAYTDVRGLAILDTSTDQTRRVLDSDTEPCKSAPRGETLLGCGTFLRPSWSPDGILLAMLRIFSDSGEVLVVDVNAEPPGVTTVEYDGLYPFEWSPSANALCAVSPGAFYPVGLIVARAPNWRPEAFLTDYQPGLLPTPAFNTGHQAMWDCTWLNESTLAVMHDVFIEPAQRPKEILILDLETSEVRNFQEHNEFTGSRSILAIPDRRLLISQFHHHTEYPDPIGDTTTPEVVDAETGARAPILTTRDRVVAAVPAELLAR